ncbi:uncharacterized protein LOC124204252 [Daphnia pulex]|uniref:uncharacterized protein LOC124204252 n=1 Tax=Daphnia pulex TaxID=6669 RepID=UPI001EDE6E63|nr:uncharacterized protein LOC124204252 [Daphnia pulex]
MVWCRFLLIHWLIVFARSEVQSENHEGPTSTASAFCSSECNQQIENRLETIVSAVRTIVSALLSTKNDVLSSVREILLQDPSITSMVPALNSAIFSSTVRSENSSFFENAGSPGKQVLGGHQPENSKAVENLKGVVKCSLIAYLDVDMIDFNSYVNQSTHVTASLANESLEIKWPLYSAACLKFSSGVWIRIYQQSTENDYKLQPETSLFVPQKCLKKNFETSYSIVLLPFSSNEKKNSCAFSLARNLIQCRVYVIEVIPNFQSLRGSKTLRTEIVVPPKRINEPSMKPLISVVAHSNSLMLNWEDNSGCAPQLTSFKLTIFPDGIVEDEGTNTTVTIPRICLKQSPNEDNLFSLVLPNNKPTSCPIEWKPLDRCRKYRLDMVSIYSVIWSGPSSSSDIFTVQQEETVNFSTHSAVIWNCPRQHYYCKHQKRSRSGCVHIRNHICDGIDHCSGRDETYCDLNVCNNGGWRCGRQCIPKELVCDGKYDCLDASDEVNCSHVNTCVQLTNPSGNFISQPFLKPAVDIHWERLPDAVRKSSVLITVQPNHQIWLTFGKFVTFENQNFVKIYDGPFSTSPLLFSHSGSVKPSYSVRSSSNDLFVEFPSYYDPNYGIEAFYASVKTINGTDKPFVPGCGGYIYGEGIISTPNYLSSSGIVECFWFVETRQSEHTILMRNNFSDIKITALLSRAHPEMIVYDGWDMDGRVIYNEKSFHVRNKTIVYSISNKILVHFKPPEVKDGHVFNWDVSKISTP